MRGWRGEGSRKFTVVMAGLAMGFVLVIAGVILAARAMLSAEYVRLVEAFAGMVSVGIGAFMVGNAVEHYAKKGKTDAPGPDGGV